MGEDGGLELPCNKAENCGFKQKPDKIPPNLKQCAKKMLKLECVESYGKKKECMTCAKSNKKALKKAGCSSKSAKKVCEYAESNKIGKEKPNKIPPKLKQCAKQMLKLECVESSGKKKECTTCAKSNKKALKKAGCSSKSAKQVCEYAESNKIGK